MVGLDGQIYAAACAKSVPCGAAKVARYNESTDALDYLFSFDEMVNDPGDSGRATQCEVYNRRSSQIEFTQVIGNEQC